MAGYRVKFTFYLCTRVLNGMFDMSLTTRSQERREDFDLTRLNEISVHLLVIHNDNDDTVLSLFRIYMA
jgi:hypothetical protein